MTARHASIGIRPFFALGAASAMLCMIAVSCGAESEPPEAPAAAAAPDQAERAPDGSIPVIVTLTPPAARDDVGPPPDGEEDDGEDQLIECVRDADCQDASFCNGYEVCGPTQRCMPGQLVQCPAFLPFCDEDQTTCVCSPGSCPMGTQCDGFGCR